MAVGELFLAAFFQVLFDRLASRELLQFLTQEGLCSKVKRWEKKLKMIEAVLIDAEEKQLTDRAIQMWLDDLQDLAFDAEDILDEFATEALARKLSTEEHQHQHQASSSKVIRKLVPGCFSGLTPTAWKFNSNMGAKIDDITSRLEELCNKKTELGLEKIAGQRSSTASWQRPPTTFLPTEPAVYGRDKDKARILEMVLSDGPREANFGVIPIVGMGGIGKTTLAREVYNDKAVEDFNPKVWVCVSDDFDVLRISKAILESITFLSCDMKELNAVQVRLKEAMNGKKFLLVLDDVWNKNYDAWETLKSPFMFGARGSKIIITTRLQEVASTMRPGGGYELELLSDDNCWLVFMKHAFEDGNTVAHQNSEAIHRKVVQKCKGLPLAARTLGGLLCSKQKEEWMDVLNNRIWDLPIESGILPALRLSFYHLPSHLKRCFSYCAIFPNDYEFEEKELVTLWIAEGLIQQSRDNEQLEDLGGEYFRDLLSRSIFQTSSNDSTKFIMHDIVNDLAQLVSKKVSFRLEDASNTDRQLKIREMTRYSSFVCYRYNCKSRFEVFNNVEHLRTLLPMPPINDFATIRYMSHTVLLDLLSKFKKLRVFSLRKFYIVELPSSIGGLRHLRYLDLSDSKIKILPESINSLYNLQTLLLRNCYCLLKLPSNIGNLTSLRYLDLFGTSSIKEMPLGMRKLKCLRTLSNFIVGKGSGSSLKDLNSLQFLRGRLHISRLENAIDFQDTREIILSNKKDLESLVLEWKSQFDDPRDVEVEEDVLQKLQPHKSIKELTVICYGGTKFPSWIRDPSFSKVTVMTLTRCEKCTVLPSLGLLSSLKNLTISRMRGLKRIGSEFHGKGCLRPFQSLETLRFEYLEEWEYWEPIEENKHVESFTSLRELHIIRCPKLSQRLPSRLFSLEKVVIHKCAQLVISFTNIPMLCEVEIDECKKIVCNTPTNFKSLKSVTISNISDFGNWLRQDFQKVECLRIEDCEELRSLWQNEICIENPAQGLHTLTYLRELYIINCTSLTSLPERIKQDNAHLEKLHIEECHYLKFVFRGSLPPSLKRLEIRNCGNLQCMLEGEEDNCATSYCSSTSVMDKENVKTSTSLLEYLFIKACPSLTCLSNVQLPDMLTHLIVWKCSRLKTFSSRGQLPTALKYLKVEECYELTTLSPRGQLPETLETLIIEKCPKLESVVERFPCSKCLNYISICECESIKSIPEGLHELRGLRKIKLWGCPSLVSFPERGFPNTDLSVCLRGCEKLKALPSQIHTLTSLGELSLYRCPSMLFPEEGFPTNITSLSIEGLNLYKPLTEWGLQNLTNLRELSIFGCLDEVAFPEEEMPPTLTYLQIENFPNLKNLSSKGFQNLTSFKSLWLYDCPKLVSLPSLPPSFSVLYIGNCPLLKKECRRDKGKEWSKIADIPCVYIDSKFFYEE